MADIFISHARSTVAQARQIGQALTTLGYSVWIDDELPSHRTYGEVLEEQLDLAKAVVVVWSAAAARSQWVRSEADRARGEGKLVQLAIDDTRLPMPFDQIHCADLSDWTGQADHAGWMTTVTTVAALAGPGTSAPAPARSGPVAILAAEIDGLDRLRLNHRAALAEAMEVCASAFQADVEARGGTVFRNAEGAMMAAFSEPEAAVAAAVRAQLGLAGRAWPELGVLKVRMAIDVGAPERRGLDYAGPVLNRVARLLALGQGGQILATSVAAEPLAGRSEFSFRSLGAHALEDPLEKVSLYQIMAQGLTADFAPLAAEETAALGNLPRRPGALIGREADIDQIAALFETSDLVTVTGAGGVGKTRIAIEYAHRRQGRHEDGVWLVELAPLTDPALVTGAIARALGFDLPPMGDPVEALIARLRPRDCLIVLDNCEHVIDAVAAVAEAAQEHAPRVKLLASSQELIGVEGERVFRLRSLGEPDAAALFVERAQGADAAFQVRGGDAAAIAAICQRLDGIPLAIEMAAARAPALGCEGVLTRLDDRFRILTGGRRTALPRQRTLQATLDWSCGLLSPQEAAVFARLGVFTGGFTLEAASEVAGDDTLDALEVIDILSSLVAKSLVAADAGEGRTRYRLLETTRMYALERLAEADETISAQRRHADYFARFAAGAAADYHADASDDVFHARYAGDLDNIERALVFAFGGDGDDDLALWLTAQAYPIWAAFSKLPAYLAWADLALARLTPQTPAPATLAVRQGAAGANANARMMMAPPLFEQILPDLRANTAEPQPLVSALYNYTLALLLLGRRDEALAAQAELDALVAPLSTTRGKISSHLTGAWLAAGDDDFDRGAALLEAGAEMAKDVGAAGWASLLWLETQTMLDDARPDERIALARQLLAGIRPTHMFRGWSIQLATWTLAQWLALRQAPGDVEEGYALARGLEKTAGRSIFSRFLVIPVLLAVADGRPADGARLYGFAQARGQALGVRLVIFQDMTRVGREALAGRLTDAEIDDLAAEGARMTDEQHFVLAMNLG